MARKVKAETVRVRVSFEFKPTPYDTLAGTRSWFLYHMRDAGVKIERLRVERVPKGGESK